MKYLDEYRDGRVAAALADEIRRTVTRPWTLMEVCGGQTHSIVRYGIDRMIPESVELVHGPATLTPQDLEQIRLRLDAAALLFRVRVLSEELRERELDVPVARKTI